MFSANRKNDAVFKIIQDNTNHTLRIEECNKAALELVGYAAYELQGKSLYEILPSPLQETIENYLNEEEKTLDLSMLLRRTRHFSVNHKNGENIPVQLKIFYSFADGDNPIFELLLRDVRLQQKIEDCREKLHEDRAAYMDQHVGLITREAVVKDIEVIGSVVAQYELSAAFLLVKIENFYTMLATHGNGAMRSLIRTLNMRFRAICREDDIISYLGEGSLGLVLFDCSAEQGKKVAERFRTEMINHPVELPSEEWLYPDIVFCVAEIYPHIHAEALIDNARRMIETREENVFVCALRQDITAKQ